MSSLNSAAQTGLRQGNADKPLLVMLGALIAATVAVVILALAHSPASATHGSAAYYPLIQYHGTGAPPAAASTRRAPMPTRIGPSFHAAPLALGH
jgi:hypothetical protein